MKLSPRIAIPLPTLERPEYNASGWAQYAAAVERFGADAIAVPLDLAPAQIARLVTGCQGVLLPGSPADVNPARYGHERMPETAEPDAAREDADELLIQDAYNLHKPLLAICYGLQSLNVWCTGTLVQDLLPISVNHRAGRSVETAHSVVLEPGSRLAAIVEGSSEKQRGTPGDLRLPVNSSHHQAVDTPGDGLQVVARCPEDDVIEAVEGMRPGHFVVGLQWHPERSFETSAVSRRIFESFVEAVRAWHPRANAVGTVG